MFNPNEEQTDIEEYTFLANITTSTVSSVTEEIQITSKSGNTTWQDYVQTCTASASSDFVNSPLFHACVYFMYCTVFVVALVGNGLVCAVVQRSPRMKTVTNYFIVNLAVGDILMTLFCVPFSFVSTLILRHWPFGALMCRIVNYSQAVSVLVSAYTLLAISVDRYMAIMRPLRPRLGRAAAKAVVGGVWVGALATAAPIPVVSTLHRPSPWHQFCEADVCLEQWERPHQSEQYTCALLTLQFALPLGALVCTYARIAHAVWGGRPPGEAQSARDSRMQRSKRKVLWTIHENDENWGSWPGMPYMWFASHWLAMSHSCYNPIIYCYMNARYRRGFKQALSALLCMRSEKPSQFCHRSSMCDGVPMSVPLNVEYTEYKRGLTHSSNAAGDGDVAGA
ncbi:RYamide receptor [Eumeta japonica]|uniref:RYamide receptor n=1 Tax=Eumeta variegata TaxID=151549 RepID=A0A4C1YIJ6_EUMVA|nr:RYamide receptor [Eumeta japonica]